jgi:hypothetical protein
VESIYRRVIHCVIDQIPYLQNCLTTPNKNLGGEGPQIDKHLHAAKSRYRSIFKKRRPLGFGVSIVIWSMHTTDTKLEGEKNDYVVLKLNIHGLDETIGCWFGEALLRPPPPHSTAGFWTDN